MKLFKYYFTVFTLKLMSSLLLHIFLFFIAFIGNLHSMAQSKKLAITWDQKLFAQKNREIFEQKTLEALKNSENPPAKETKFTKLLTEYLQLDLAELETAAAQIIDSEPKNYYKALAILEAAKAKKSDDYDELHKKLLAKHEEAIKPFDPQFQYECAYKSYFEEKNSGDPAASNFPKTKIHLSEALVSQGGTIPYHPRALWLHEHLGFEECRNKQLQKLYTEYDSALSLFKDDYFEQSVEKLEPLCRQNFMPAILLLAIIKRCHQVKTCLEEKDTADTLEQLVRAEYPPAHFLATASALTLDTPTYKKLKNLLNNYSAFESAEAYLLLAFLEIIYTDKTQDTSARIIFLLHQCLNNMRPSSKWLIKYLVSASSQMVKDSLAQYFNTIKYNELKDPTKGSFLLSDVLEFMLLLHEEGSLWAGIHCMPYAASCPKTYQEELLCIFERHYVTFSSQPWIYLPFINFNFYPTLHSAFLALSAQYKNGHLCLETHQKVALLYTRELLQPTLIMAVCEEIKNEIQEYLNVKKAPRALYKLCAILQYYSKDVDLSSKALQLINENVNDYPNEPALLKVEYHMLIQRYLEKVKAMPLAVATLNAKFLNPIAACKYGMRLATSENTIFRGLSTMYLKQAHAVCPLQAEQLNQLTTILYTNPELQQFSGERVVFLCEALMAGSWRFTESAQILLANNKNIQELWQCYPAQRTIETAEENFVIATLFTALAQQTCIKTPNDTSSISSYIAKASRLIVQAFLSGFTNSHKQYDRDVILYFFTLNSILTTIETPTATDGRISKQAKNLKTLIKSLKVKYETPAKNLLAT